MTSTSSNYQKYHAKNPCVVFLITRFLNRLSQIVSTLDAQNILEVGCGEGFVISHLRRSGIRASFEGIDKSEEALLLARGLNPGVPFSRGDVCSLRFKDKSFDAVLALELLEHLHEPGRALEEICRVSRQCVILSVPHEPLFSLGNLARGRHIRRLGRDPEHVQFWSQRSFIRMVTPYFKQVRNMSTFPWTLCIGTGPQ